jgi:hypothetical protein
MALLVRVSRLWAETAPPCLRLLTSKRRPAAAMTIKALAFRSLLLDTTCRPIVIGEEDGVTAAFSQPAAATHRQRPMRTSPPGWPRSPKRPTVNGER